MAVSHKMIPYTTQPVVHPSTPLKPLFKSALATISGNALATSPKAHATRTAVATQTVPISKRAFLKFGMRTLKRIVSTTSSDKSL